MSDTVISDSDQISGQVVTLRLLTLKDCTQEYVNWLNDKEINQFLETRWAQQDIESIRDFVAKMRNDSSSYLFAIIYNDDNSHVGNIKLGPINPYHSYADVSYFVGNKSVWGKGIATEAVCLIKSFAFDVLGLNSLWAGVYEANLGSYRTLEKNGFTKVGFFPNQLLTEAGYQAHIFMGVNNNKKEMIE